MQLDFKQIVLLLLREKEYGFFRKEILVIKFDDFKHYSWLDIENPDMLHELKLIIKE